MNYVVINNQKEDLNFHMKEYKNNENKQQIELKIKDELIKIDLEYVKTENNIATYSYELNSNEIRIRKKINLPVCGKALDSTEILIFSEINESMGQVAIDFQLKETGINMDLINDDENDILFLPFTLIFNIDESSIEYLEYTNPKDDDFTYQTQL